MDGQNYILGVAGRKGSGKSTFVRQRLPGIERLAIIDTLGEYTADVPAAPGEPWEQVLALAKFRNLEPFRMSFLLPPHETSAVFDALCRAAYMAGNCTVVIEEIDYFSKPSWNEEGLDLLIRYGRHANVNIIYTVRNLVETSRRLTSQTDVFVFFNVDEPRYLDGIEERFGPEVSTRVALLENHAYTIVNQRERKPQETQEETSESESGIEP